MSNLYDVTIASISKAAPADGFIDPFRIEYYRAQENAPKGTSMDVMATKKKGFVRWHRIENQLQCLGNIYCSNITAPGGTVNATPTSVSFRVLVEHGIESVSTPDELNVGQVLTGADALKRAVARALCSSLIANQEVWDPTTVGSTEVVSFGFRTIELNVGALAADIAEANGKINVTAV
jgi:hypothetical protein